MYEVFDGPEVGEFSLRLRSLLNEYSPLREQPPHSFSTQGQDKERNHIKPYHPEGLISLSKYWKSTETTRQDH